MRLPASSARAVSRTRYAILTLTVPMVSWKPQPAYTIYGFVIANVVCGDESKTLFLITSNAKDEGSPKLKTEIAQSLLEKKSGEGLPIFPRFLESYIKSASEFNAEIDRTGADTTRHMETTSQDANALMMKSQVRYQGQMLMRVCMQLLEDYPLWTYTPNYYPLRPL